MFSIICTQLCKARAGVAGSPRLWPRRERIRTANLAGRQCRRKIGNAKIPDKRHEQMEPERRGSLSLSLSLSLSVGEIPVHEREKRLAAQSAIRDRTA